MLKTFALVAYLALAPDDPAPFAVTIRTGLDIVTCAVSIDTTEPLQLPIGDAAVITAEPESYTLACLVELP